MDGGRALRALLATRVGTYRATEVAAKVGKAAALVMGVVGVVWGPFLLAVVAAFVWFAANAEQQASRAEAYLQGRSWRSSEGEVLGAPSRRRGWGDLFSARSSGRAPRGAEPWEARRVYEAMRPVRVVLLRRGWF
jgi:hypothetical protein